MHHLSSIFLCQQEKGVDGDEKSVVDLHFAFHRFLRMPEKKTQRSKQKTFWAKFKEYVLRTKNDLDDVENRIQRELKAISLEIDLKADSEDQPRPDEKLWDHRSICVE